MTKTIPGLGPHGVPRNGWRSQAACLAAEADLFFPVGSTGPAVAQIERAKTVCRRCLVLDVCRDVALATRQDHGVWGGMSEEERRSHARRLARVARQERNQTRKPPQGDASPQTQDVTT
jgi:WhiB family transcriptional regulator, redox-sensing transcriptional regulator